MKNENNPLNPCTKKKAYHRGHDLVKSPLWNYDLSPQQPSGSRVEVVQDLFNGSLFLDYTISTDNQYWSTQHDSTRNSSWGQNKRLLFVLFMWCSPPRASCDYPASICWTSYCIWEWWHVFHMKYYWFTKELHLVALVQPSSALAERVFSQVALIVSTIGNKGLDGILECCLFDKINN